MFLLPPLGTGCTAELRLLLGVCGARLLDKEPVPGTVVSDRTPTTFLCATCGKWGSSPRRIGVGSRDGARDRDRDRDRGGCEPRAEPERERVRDDDDAESRARRSDDFLGTCECVVR
jgi:hypothetical protein